VAGVHTAAFRRAATLTGTAIGPVLTMAGGVLAMAAAVAAAAVPAAVAAGVAAAVTQEDGGDGVN
jgi:hypothetical protein